MPGSFSLFHLHSRKVVWEKKVCGCLNHFVPIIEIIVPGIRTTNLNLLVDI